MEERNDPAAKSSESEDIEVVEADDEAGDEVVADPDEQVAALEAKLAEEHERLLRTAAELENFRKRARRDADDALARGRSEVLIAILPALDSVDMALKSTTEEASAASVLEGVEMVRKQFLASMAPLGLKPIDADGAGFDPTYHEAVAQMPSVEHAAGSVMEEMRKGYMLGDRLLRASMVVVSSGKPAGSETADESDPEVGAEETTELDDSATEEPDGEDENRGE